MEMVVPTPPASMPCIEMQATGESETECVCFVCMEPCEQESKCKCTDRYVHSACLLKWLQTKTRNHCDVCLEEYPDMNLQAEATRKPSVSCCICAVGGLCYVAFLTGGSILLSMYLSRDHPSGTFLLGVGILLMGLSVVGLVLCTIGLLRFRRERYRFWSTYMERRVVASVT